MLGGMEIRVTTKVVINGSNFVMYVNQMICDSCWSCMPYQHRNKSKAGCLKVLKKAVMVERLLFIRVVLVSVSAKP